MALDRFITAWSGTAYRHIPEGGGYRLLDFSRAGLSAENRWNEPGEPTVYLASDKRVVVAEIGRHLEESSAPTLTPLRRPRRIYRLDVTLASVFDLCRPDAWAALSLADAPACFLDRARARSIARFVRANTDAQAILVPSMTFLDQLDRWVLALFLERLPVEPTAFIHRVAPNELLRLGEDTP